MPGTNGHRPPQQAAAATTITVIDGGQLYHQMADMAATLVETKTLLAAHLESEREARERRQAERDGDDARFAQLERRVWSIPGAGTLIALAGVVVAVLALRGG